MKTQETAAGRQGDFHGRLKIGDEGLVVSREARQRPFTDGLHLSVSFRRDVLLTGFYAREQPGIRVAHHDGAGDLA
jgi:hypothetical protein